MSEIVEIRVPEFETECKAYLSFWYKNIGDEVQEGEELFDMETDKAAIAVESPASGRLVEILLREDEPLKPGDLAGRLEVERG